MRPRGLAVESHGQEGDDRRRSESVVVILRTYMRTPSLLVVALGCSALQTPPPPARRTAAAPNYACGPASKPAPPVQLPADKQVDISIEH